jgi:hypothetical protein
MLKQKLACIRTWAKAFNRSEVRNGGFLLVALPCHPSVLELCAEEPKELEPRYNASATSRSPLILICPIDW